MVMIVSTPYFRGFQVFYLSIYRSIYLSFYLSISIYICMYVCPCLESLSWFMTILSRVSGRKCFGLGFFQAKTRASHCTFQTQQGSWGCNQTQDGYTMSGQWFLSVKRCKKRAKPPQNKCMSLWFREVLLFAQILTSDHFWLVVWNIFYFSIYWE